MRKVISIHTGDIHLTEHKPIARVDEPDWFEAQTRVLDYVNTVCSKFEAPLIVGGDMFDRVDVSHTFLNRLYRHRNRDCYAIVGNHEQPNKNNVGMEASAWTTAHRMGFFTGFSSLSTIMISNVIYTFIPATNSEEEFMGCVRDTPKVSDVIVLHRFTWYEEKPMHSTDNYSAEYLLKLFPYAKTIFTSDNHHGFVCNPENSTGVVCNCGMLIRDNADLIDYVPRIYLLYNDFSIDTVYIPTDKDLITDRHIVARKEAKEQEELFVRSLDETKDISLSFEDNLMRRVDGQQSKDYVLDSYNEIK